MRRRSFRQRRANGHDRIARQAYLGHRNIQHTVRYTELSPMRFKNFWRAFLLTNVPLVPRCSCLTANRGRVWGLHDDEEITAARVHCCRKGSNGKGRTMRPRTRRDGRNYSSLCAIRRQSFGIGRHIGARPGGCGANGTPSVHPRAFLLGGIHGRAASWHAGGYMEEISKHKPPHRGSGVQLRLE